MKLLEFYYNEYSPDLLKIYKLFKFSEYMYKIV